MKRFPGVGGKSGRQRIGLFVLWLLTAAGGLLLIWQTGRIASLEAEIAERDPMPVRPARDDTRFAEKRDSRIDVDLDDWSAVADGFRSAGIGLFDPARAWQLKLTEMSFDELRDTRRAYLAADLSKWDRELLEREWLRAMFGKEGREADTLSEYMPRIGEMGSTMAAYFGRWISRDADAAIDWFRNHLGTAVDPESPVAQRARQFIEAGVYGELETSPENSRALLQAVHPERRLESLRSLSISRMTPETRANWVEMVRESMPPDQVATVLAWPTWNWSDGDGSRMDFDETAAYLEEISADAEVSRKVWESMARDIRWGGGGIPEFGDAVTEFRNRLADEDPVWLNRTTGELLAEAQGQDFDKRLDLATRFYEESGDTSVILPLLLGNVPDKSRGAARDVARSLVTDERQREQLMEALR
ncbi:hypothetical protein HAHE_10060 [Haloferula helveola]|uniref:Uncharacterized protein n=1 Tax=Haloferula helveola TaxID=490095 RepID=A0ABM7RHG0_9BACT|nr:hypothetical protein HAHE_10060 [Haloferula helveola]